MANATSNTDTQKPRYSLFQGSLKDLVERLYTKREKAHLLVTPNIDHYRLLARSSAFRRAYRSADHIVNDSRFLNELIFCDSVLCAPGADLVPIVIKELPEGSRVSIVGYSGAIRNILLMAFPKLRFDFFQPSMGYIKNRVERKQLQEFVSNSCPNLLLICTGAPQSEVLAKQLKSRIKSNPLIICCGSALHFMTGAKARAPGLVRTIGMEWLWRFVSEPHTRPRYLFDAIFFVASFRSFAALRVSSRARFCGFTVCKGVVD